MSDLLKNNLKEGSSKRSPKRFIALTAIADVNGIGVVAGGA
jgi:hypothetical protein